MSDAKREWHMQCQMQANDHAQVVNILRAQVASLESNISEQARRADTDATIDDLILQVHAQAATIAKMTTSRDQALAQMSAQSRQVRRLEQDIASLTRHASDSNCVRACSVCFEPITTHTASLLSNCHHETCCECMPTILGGGGSCPVCCVVSPKAITGYLSFMEKAMVEPVESAESVESVEPVRYNVQESRRREAEQAHPAPCRNHYKQSPPQRWSMILVTGVRFDAAECWLDRVETSLQLLQIPLPRSHPRMCVVEDKYSPGMHCVKMFYNEDEAEGVCAKLVDVRARTRKDILAGNPDPVPWLSSCDTVRIAGLEIDRR